MLCPQIVLRQRREQERRSNGRREHRPQICANGEEEASARSRQRDRPDRGDENGEAEIPAVVKARVDLSHPRKREYEHPGRAWLDHGRAGAKLGLRLEDLEQREDREHQVEVSDQLRVHDLRGAHGREREQHRANGGCDRATAEAAREEEKRRQEVERGDREQPQLKGSVGLEAGESPGPVEGGDAEKDVGVGGRVGRREEHRRAPEALVSRHADEPSIAVLEDIVVEPGVAPIALHSAQAGEQHGVELQQHPDDPCCDRREGAGHPSLLSLSPNAASHAPPECCWARLLANNWHLTFKHAIHTIV